MHGQGEVRVSVGGNVNGQLAAGNHVFAQMGGMAGEPDQRDDVVAAHRVVVNLDVQGSGRRDSVGQRHMRQGVAGCVRAGTAALGVGDETFDRGDGLVVVMPGTVSVVAVLDTFVEAVAAALREHNVAASEAYRIDLRAAVHIGHLDRVGAEWSGSAMVHAARLVDAAEVKAALERDPVACLAVVLSDAVKRVVDDGYCRVRSDGYRHTAVAVKETVCDGWWRLV
ncbi:hypothetical protein JOD54_004288 [Actinokineospora baliensis]|uniref:hypothetical protein n=1 Tax=Actinokineospora baliensis TaxID=547056 RepID=UPI00195B58A5|nr:hypothetical protein [Actinokineospora baliensis]MBM7774084.1 hypothetical protein [Actinokineospora baliensis]